MSKGIEIMGDDKQIYCCKCKKNVGTKLVKGDTIYPHRQDLHNKNFYQCECGGFVGCHPRSDNPLGCIPTKKIKEARQHIHAILDPFWKNQKEMRVRKKVRTGVYKLLSEKLGYEYHTAEIRDIEEARKIYKILKDMRDNWRKVYKHLIY